MSEKMIGVYPACMVQSSMLLLISDREILLDTPMARSSPLKIRNRCQFRVALPMAT